MHGLLLIAMQLEGRNKEENGNSRGILFDYYLHIPLNGIENKLITVANNLIKEYRKERESQKMAYYKTIAIVILSSLLLISILVFCIVC